MAPVVVGWIKALPPEQQSLFAGGKCGWETTANSQYAYFKNDNSYYDRTGAPKWDNTNKQYIGYNAARTAGIQTSGVLDYEHSYGVSMKIIGRHLGFLTATARSLGLPRERIFAFRNAAPFAPAHFIAWVGTYDDFKNALPGQSRISLPRTFKDGFYPGIHLLPDGTIVTTTYTTYRRDDGGCSIVSVRFQMSEIDAMAANQPKHRNP